MVNSGVGLFFFLLALAVLLLSVPQLLTLRLRNWLTWFRPGYGAFLIGWVAIPVMAVAASTNQAERYAVASLPAAAVILAGLITGLPWASIRRVTVAFLVAVAVDAALYTSLAGFTLPLIPSYVAFSTPFGTASAQVLSPPGLGDAPFPSSQNYSLNVIKYLESKSRGSSGRIERRTIALLELQGYLNGNNLPYWADIRHDPFTFATLFRAQSTGALAAEFEDLRFRAVHRAASSLAGGCERKDRRTERHRGHAPDDSTALRPLQATPSQDFCRSGPGPGRLCACIGAPVMPFTP